MKGLSKLRSWRLMQDQFHPPFQKPNLHSPPKAPTLGLGQFSPHGNTYPERYQARISIVQGKSNEGLLAKVVGLFAGVPILPPKNRRAPCSQSPSWAHEYLDTAPRSKDFWTIITVNCHFRPSSFAASISSAVMNPFMRDLISQIFSITALPKDSSTCATAANSAMTSWFTLLRFFRARSFKASCSSFGTFRIVNVAMTAF